MCISSIMLSIVIKILIPIVSALNVDFPRPPNIAIVEKKSETSDELMSINLKMMSDSYLANENLPIWIVGLNSIELAPHVMENIGPFFMYRDMDTCSAAVYFSKRNQFDGTIGNREVFHHVNYNAETKRVRTSHSTIYQSEISHAEQIQMEVFNEVQPITSISESDEQGTDADPLKYRRSRLPYQHTAYIEIFVIVDYDITLQFEHDYAAMVSYLLVMFNSVDMLYANTKNPNIKINIAGILISDTRLAFSDLIDKNCYESLRFIKRERLNAVCAANAMRDILEENQDDIKFNSFDLVVFLTDFQLQVHSRAADGTLVTHFLNGYMDVPDGKFYNGYKLIHDDIKVAVVYNSIDISQSIPVIAHELAHGFNVSHDYGDFRGFAGECTGNLMRSYGSFCRKCLYFSDNTFKQMRRFFGSRDGCIFYNEPKSLFHPLSEPRSFWTEDKQCHCYGYDAAYNSQLVSTFWTHFKRILMPEINCDRRLKCVGYVKGKRVTEETAYYMDGTPCHENKKVCWNQKCKTQMK